MRTSRLVQDRASKAAKPLLFTGRRGAEERRQSSGLYLRTRAPRRALPWQIGPSADL